MDKLTIEYWKPRVKLDFGPLCFIVLRHWYKPGCCECFEREVSAFKDLQKAKYCCNDDRACYEPSVMNKWKMSWMIIECPVRGFAEASNLERARNYRKLDSTTYKRHCPPRTKPLLPIIFDV